MAAEAVLKMKENKACGRSWILIEKFKAEGDAMLWCHHIYDQPDN